MRTAIVITGLVAALGHVSLMAQQAAPRGRLYRGPLYASRPATLIEPERRLPLEFSNSRFSLGTPQPLGRLGPARLETAVRSLTLRTVRVSGIVLRIALGPTEHGMITFRMRGQAADDDSQPSPERLVPGAAAARTLTFTVAREDPAPGMLALARDINIVFTLERIDSDEGQPLFENPHATELLWQALGKPTLSTQ